MPTPMKAGPEALLRVSGEIVHALGGVREQIDGLNVYPVADADTGTNLFLTFETAHGDLQATVTADPHPELADLAGTYARSLLFAARGNSGVIMSQLFGALVQTMSSPGDEPLPVVLARAMTDATEAAYAAVGTPVEGTILSVARAASDAATQQADRAGATVPRVLRAATAAAREALDRTPQQLEVLRRAGVVDAGGAGLCVVLQAIETAVTGRVADTGASRSWTRLRSGDQGNLTGDLAGDLTGDLTGDLAGDLTGDGPAYEVMYLLDADEDRIPELRSRLAALGDSLVVVGGGALWNVHVHVDDVGAAVEAGIEAGRPHRVRVTHFAEQLASRVREPRSGRRVVAVAAGRGLAEVFRSAGARVVVHVATSRPSSDELLEAVLDVDAAEVMLLPNDATTLKAAEAAAGRAREDHGLRVAVVPTLSQVQGLAALAMHDEGRSFDRDLVEMTAAARHARSGAVTVADREAMTSAGPCRPGDVLGVVEGDFVLVGHDAHEVALGVLDLMVGGGGELVTVVTGEGGQELADTCVRHARVRYPHLDVVEYDGGQERYSLLLGVE